MKICYECHNIVADDDGMELNDGSFYCASSGCKKEYLDEVVENQVIPDLMRTGTVLRMGSSSKPFKFPSFHKTPAALFATCENCGRKVDVGQRHFFYYGYQAAAPANVPPDRYVRLGKTDFLIAGRGSAMLCDICIKRPQRQRLYKKIGLSILGIIAFPGIYYLLAPKSPQYLCLALPVLVIAIAIFLARTYKDDPTSGDNLAIQLKQAPLLAQGFGMLVSEYNFKDLWYKNYPRKSSPKLDVHW